MRSFSDDIPNITKEELERAGNTAARAVEVSQATLSATEEALDVIQGNRKLLRIGIGLGILNLLVTSGLLVLLLADQLLG